MPQSNAPTSRRFGQVSRQTGREPARSISWKAAEARGAAEQGSLGPEQEGSRDAAAAGPGPGPPGGTHLGHPDVLHSGSARPSSSCTARGGSPVHLASHRLPPALLLKRICIFFNNIFSFYVFLAFSGADGKEEGRVYCRQMMCPCCDAGRSAAGSTSPAAAMPSRRRGCSWAAARPGPAPPAPRSPGTERTTRTASASPGTAPLRPCSHRRALREHKPSSVAASPHFVCFLARRVQ